MAENELKRFPEDFDEIGRDLLPDDLVLGVNRATGQQVIIKTERLGGGSGNGGGTTVQTTFFQQTDPSLTHDMIEGVSKWVVDDIEFTWLQGQWIELN